MWEGIEGRRRRGWQRMRWLDRITDSVDINVSKLRETVKDGEAWLAAAHGVTESETWLSDWTTATASSVTQMSFHLNKCLYWSSYGSVWPPPGPGPHGLSCSVTLQPQLWNTRSLLSPLIQQGNWGWKRLEGLNWLHKAGTEPGPKTGFSRTRTRSESQAFQKADSWISLQHPQPPIAAPSGGDSLQV